MQNCQDAYFATFPSFAELFGYQQQVNDRSTWTHCAVNQLHVEPLNRNSSCYPALKEFAPGVSQEAVEDSFNNLGLAIRFDQKLYPVRETAYKSLLDRAKISGSGLNKLTKDELAQVLNTFLGHFRSEALVLVRDEKISAVHSGDEADYSILPIDRLLNVLQSKLGDRFPGNVFEGGYSDHAITSAAWSLPDQKEDLIGAYARLLASKGKSAMASRLMPGVRFLTSDTGISSAKMEAVCGKRTFREGDKVMQIKNFEDVSNGDIGTIAKITQTENEVRVMVDFGDGRVREYDSADLAMLDLGYATTIHKSQGSEYSSVIINLQCAHTVMLNRPLIYTAVTRGKDRVILVGERKALCIAIRKTETEKRGTCLAHRIQALNKE